jgi:hypothetical protein
MEEKIIEFDLRKWQDGGLTSFAETCFAEYWNELTPILEDDTVELDPYNFLHRMVMGKLVIENSSAINGSASKVWGKNDEKHWLWAYLAQLDWQRRSGRLSDPSVGTKSKDIQISVKSWFGFMNCNFIMAIYEGAINANLMDKKVCKPIKKVGDQVDLRNDPSYVQCLKIWTSFFKETHLGFMEDVSSLSWENSIDEKSLKSQLYNYYDKLWMVHKETIETSIEHSKHLQELLPELERKFSIGFCRVPDMLQSMSWIYLGLDDLMTVGVGYLPSKFLTDQNILDSMKQKHPDEYITATQCIDFSAASPTQLKIVFGFFRRLARWEDERERMPETMKALNGANALVMKKIAVLIRVLLKVTLPRKLDFEALFWTVVFILFIVLGYGKEVTSIISIPVFSTNEVGSQSDML